MKTTETLFHELVELVETAGLHAREYFDSADVSNEQKNDGSVVTEIDKKIETIIVDFVRTHFPDDAIRGEEHGEKEGSSGYVWHIDPIDGTDNFLRRIPFCAISVARLGDDNDHSFAIVHNPITKQTFSTFHEGATYENNRICNLTSAFLGGKLTFSIGRGREGWMKPAGYALQAVFGMKYGRGTSYNCTALELAYLSADRIDAFLTYGLHSYDYAAGLLLAQTAKGAISRFEEGKGWVRYTGSIKELCAVHGDTIFVSHPDIHDELTALIGNPQDWEKDGKPNYALFTKS
jgi:myo-inositol-1(or 4)-monophosphatase